MQYDWRIVDTIKKVVDEGKEIVATNNTCEAKCWVAKSKFLMGLNWDIILRYQGSREDNISKLLDELASTTIEVLGVDCECNYIH
jgi:hypothetical protein